MYEMQKESLKRKLIRTCAGKVSAILNIQWMLIYPTLTLGYQGNNLWQLLGSMRLVELMIGSYYLDPYILVENTSRDSLRPKWNNQTNVWFY